MRPSTRFGGLWRHPRFLKLWAGQTVSLFGSQITMLALPLLAILTLRASPAQMGLLRAFQTVPALLVGLFVGVWVDRLRRRPILLGADLGRALCLGLIPLSAALGLLRIEVLYGVGFLVGLLTVCFDVAYMSFLPSLVGHERVLEGNSKLETSYSAASIAGPSVAGLLVQAVTAPLAIALDAASFLVSALFLASLRVVEPAPAPEQRRPVWHEIGAGLRAVVGNPVLRTLALLPALVNIVLGLQATVYLLYLARGLRLAPVVIGGILTFTGPGFLLGALLASRLGQRFGPGPTLIGGAFVYSLTTLAPPLAGGPPAVVVPLLASAQFFNGVTGQLHAITNLSLRQAITPDRLLGRVNASIRLIAWSTAPLAGLLGGALGSWLGLRATLGVAAFLALGVPWFLWWSPLRGLREAPAVAATGQL